MDCAAVLKVLADDTRLRIVETLMDGPMHVHEINARVKVAQNLLSHHLRVLREAKLVSSHRDGKAVRYTLVAKDKRKRAIDLGCCRLSFT